MPSNAFVIPPLLGNGKLPLCDVLIVAKVPVQAEGPAKHAQASSRNYNAIRTVVMGGKRAPLRFRIPEDDGLGIHDADTASAVVTGVHRRPPDF